jgi:regulator of sigma E protease
VVVLGVLIIGHELGHFIFAKLFGVRVEEFGLGYPPRMFTLFEAGGTKFTMNWIPFGGFNLPAGENDPTVPDGLAGAEKHVRAAVLLGGPLANFLLAFVVFVFAFKFAAPDFEQILITDVVAGTPAAEAGIQIGDLILAVEDQPITTTDSMLQVIQKQLGVLTKIKVLRDGQELTLAMIPRSDHPPDQGPIGVVLGHPTKEMGWLEAAKFGGESIVLQIDAILRLPGRLISGMATPMETRVSGLKGIHDMLAWASSIDRTAQRPFLTLNLIGVISTGLALANLLPFPALDGGRLMFVLFEYVFRRRISPRYEGLAHAIGFTLLLGLMIYINLQDFINPIPLP